MVPTLGESRASKVAAVAVTSCRQVSEVNLERIVVVLHATCVGGFGAQFLRHIKLEIFWKTQPI